MDQLSTVVGYQGKLHLKSSSWICGNRATFQMVGKVWIKTKNWENTELVAGSHDSFSVTAPNIPEEKKEV